MKKKGMLLVMSLIIIFAFVSCEGDIFQQISNFMGGTSTNVLIDGEIVSVPTKNINALGDTLGGTSNEDVEASPEEVEAVRESVKKILESDGETEAAKALLGGDVEEDKIPSGLQGKMNDLEDELGLEDGALEIKTKGDLAAAILLADLKKKKDALPPEPTDQQKEELVEEARVAIEFVKKVSGVGDIDVTSALTDLLEDMLNRSAMRRMSSREGGEGPTEQEIIDIVIPLFNMYFNVIDTDNSGTVTPEEVKYISGQYGLIRSGYETMAPLLQDTGKEAKLSDLVNYLSSVLISANNKLIPTEVRTHTDPPTTFSVILNDVKIYVDAGDFD
ncbi:MAG: hypothetical protein EOM67_00495, partial [Spirochaetia bacterium]|nr:hypothetical protein [Spirochaetia bacterium]